MQAEFHLTALTGPAISRCVALASMVRQAPVRFEEVRLGFERTLREGMTWVVWVEITPEQKLWAEGKTLDLALSGLETKLRAELRESLH